jgi:hypothetical protein
MSTDLLDRIFSEAVTTNVSPDIQRVVETQAKQIILALVDSIPPNEELNTLGVELGNMIIDYIRTDVLNDIYYRVNEEKNLNGFDMSVETKTVLYEKVISNIPTQKAFNVMGQTLILNVQTIVKNALSFEAFSQIVDKFLVFFSSLTETVKPEAIAVAKRVGTALVLGGFVLGAASMYGFMRLYQSTTDSPFTSRSNKS